MRELNLSELVLVSGGKWEREDVGCGCSSNKNLSDKGSINKNDTRPEPSKVSNGQLAGGLVGGVIGSRLGPGGAVAGTFLGTHYGNEMENAFKGTEKYQKLGENYKDYVDKTLRDGLFHND